MSKGVELINPLDETKFEQLLKKISTKLKNSTSDIFTGDEKQKLGNIFKLEEGPLNLVLKTIIYLLRRMMKFVFKPMYLKNSLTSAGFNDEKANLFVKVWSADTKSMFDDLNIDDMNVGTDLDICWQLNAELSSNYQKKVKVPKAYLSLSDENGSQDLELDHSELYSMYMQIENIQAEFDMMIDSNGRK